MQENTYIVPAIKFFVLFFPNVNPSSDYKEYEQALYNNEYIRFPFEDIDGLTAEEVFDSLQMPTSGFMVTAGVEMQGKNAQGNQSYQNYFQYTSMFFSQKYLQSQGTNQQIDKLVEDIFEQNYMNASPRSQKCYNAFFEKYQDKDYNKTKQRIARLTNSDRK